MWSVFNKDTLLSRRWGEFTGSVEWCDKPGIQRFWNGRVLQDVFPRADVGSFCSGGTELGRGWECTQPLRLVAPRIRPAIWPSTFHFISTFHFMTHIISTIFLLNLSATPFCFVVNTESLDVVGSQGCWRKFQPVLINTLSHHRFEIPANLIFEEWLLGESNCWRIWKSHSVVPEDRVSSVSWSHRWAWRSIDFLKDLLSKDRIYLNGPVEVGCCECVRFGEWCFRFLGHSAGLTNGVSGNGPFGEYLTKIIIVNMSIVIDVKSYFLRFTDWI